MGASLYGLIGRIRTKAGKRQEFIDILLEASRIVGEFSACRQYVVAEDPADEMVLHVFEMWNDKQAHDDSLKDDRVRSLIAKATQLMDGAPEGSELIIVGGHGIPA